MRTLLRLLAVVDGFAVLVTALMIWRMWPNLSMLAESGIFGVSTFAAWILILVAGPFAAVQLWRLKQSGRKASVLLSASAFLYYTVGWLSLRGDVGNPRTLGMGVVANLLLCLLLLSPPARRACEVHSSTPTE